MENNLRFYEVGAKVPKEACRDFNNGRFKGTDINRMWRIRTLTKMFGPAGFGWTFNLTEVQERRLDGSEAVVIFAKGELKVRDPETKDWSEPIVGYGGNYIVQSFSNGTRINDEAYKMVETDAFGAACSKLGIGESVYWNESTKYAQTEVPVAKEPEAKKEEPKKTAPAVKTEISDRDMIAAIYAAKGNAKTAVDEYMKGHGILTPYETTPEQRKALYRIATAAKQ